MRDESGRFLRGKSGNPGGRPRVVMAVRDLARQHAEDAVRVLSEIMNEQDAPPAARISAASELLNRGYGRPVDQRAMLLLSQNTDSLRPLHEMSTDELLAELINLADDNMLDASTIALAAGE